ncbi:MAG: glutamine--fructose-6-phosphate transaminase (isomerizing) [Bacteroidota bacterium]
MCGIVGYLGNRDAVPVLLDGLMHLEYRGYDSAGISVVNGRSLYTVKKVGKVQHLIDASKHLMNQSTAGIAHTRWATHGEPSVHNAHPHLDCTECITVAHNGIIENYAALRKKLEPYHRFVSQTDSEVVAHLIEEYLKTEGTFEAAVMRCLKELQGTYGLAILFAYEPRQIIAARKGSPLVIGIGEEEYFLSSDAGAFRKYTDRALYLSDGEAAIISDQGVSVKDLQNVPVLREPDYLDLEEEELGKSGFQHFMEKEIFEQPESLYNAFRGRLNEAEGTAILGGIREYLPLLRDARRFILVGCGTSWHAALAGEYMMEQYTQTPVEVEYASEFRYRDPVVTGEDVVIVISQSGETADTLAAAREAKRKGAIVLGICNVVGSTIARECDGGIYMHAGPEIGVASTKAYTSQLMVLTLLTLAIAREKRLMSKEGEAIIREIKELPKKVERILSLNEKIKMIALKYCDCGNFLYLGRGYNFPNALEGALKLKEISYIHAEGYPAAEMKHGPIALIDNNMPVVFIAPQDQTYEKIISNIQEVKARKGKIIAIADEGDERIKTMCDDVIHIPKTIDLLSPVLTAIPLQMLAYHIAVLRRCNVDQPRNLAKSVTVE